jgi:hypothetical protein
MGYFSVDELFIIDNIKANTFITGVNYYRWNNLAVSKNAYVFIDKIEFEFNNIPPFLVEINETDDGICIKTNYDIALQIKEVEATFNGQIKITQKSEINNEFWRIAKNNPLKSIEAQQFQQFYANEALLFNFGEEKRAINFNHDKGLLVDYYED